MEIPKTAEFVVVGGGSIGCSIAYHLARKKAGKVVLFEKESIASGSTGRAAGFIKQQFGDDFHLDLARESVAFFERLTAEKRFGLVFRQTGYVHLLFTPQEMREARAALAIQHRYGVESEMLSPAETVARVPGLNLDGVLGATDYGRDGYADPHLATNAMAQLAREAGADIFVDTEVTGIDLEGDRIAAVRTAKGSVTTRVVVDAAGPWAAYVSRLAGIDIPVRPFRRQLWFTQAVREIGENAPILMDKHHDFYFRREGDGVVMCFGNPEEEAGLTTEVDWEFAEKVAEYASYRFPPLAQAGLVSAWAAPRDITPDHDAILGPLPAVAGLYVAAGHSGHGFMLSPGVGRMMADHIVDGHSSPDVSVLGYERFAGQAYPLAAFKATGTR